MLTEAEKRILAEKARKENRKIKIEYGALLIITILSLCGVAYNVWAVVAASGDSLWENILYGITCLFCFMIGLLAIHYDRRYLQCWEIFRESALFFLSHITILVVIY